MADAMLHHPGFFSPDEVGTIRAGERGGFLPEAMMACAEASDHARKIRSRAFYPFVILSFAVLSVPFLQASVRGSLLAVKRQDAAGG